MAGEAGAEPDAAMSDDGTPGAADLTGSVRRLMDARWRPEHGYSAPNPDTYPHLWLWDSCPLHIHCYRGAQPDSVGELAPQGRPAFGVVHSLGGVVQAAAS